MIEVSECETKEYKKHYGRINRSFLYILYSIDFT